VTIKCRDIPEKANDYVDRDGPVGERLGVALHLATCSHCRTYVRGLRFSRRIAASSFRTEAPEAVVTRLGLGDGSTTDTGKGAP